MEIEEREKTEIDLHLAEYNQLNSRITTFLKIQNTLIIVLILWIGIMGTLFISNHNLIIGCVTIVGVLLILLRLMLLSYNITQQAVTSLKQSWKTIIARNQKIKRRKIVIEDLRNKTHPYPGAVGCAVNRLKL